MIRSRPSIAPLVAMFALVSCERAAPSESPPVPNLDEAVPVAPPNARGPEVPVAAPTASERRSRGQDAGAPQPAGVRL